MNKNGLTLLETLIVLALIGLLFSIVLPIMIKIHLDSKVDPVGFYNVQYLFETNGIKVYRFRDDGKYLYFTDMRDSISNNNIEK